MDVQTDTEWARREESFSCSGPIELEVALDAGALEVKALDTERVRVELSVDSSGSPRWHRGARTLLARLGDERVAELAERALSQTEIEWSDSGRLRVRAPRTRLLRAVPLVVAVEVPQGSRLVCRSASASVRASGALGQLDAAVGWGDVAAERVDGNVEVKAGSGHVRLGRVAGRFRARSGSGDIEVASVEGKIEVASGRGALWLGVVRADARARTGSGEIAVAEARAGRLDLVTAGPASRPV